MDQLHKTIPDKVVAQYVHLARKIARKYQISGHYILDFEDLYQELQMCLVRCASTVRERSMKENETYWYVSSSLSNAAKGMLARAFGKKRNCIRVELDLSDEFAKVTSKGFEEIHERILLQQVRSLLSGIPLLVYDAILNPSDELVQLAQIETLRKSHLKEVNKIVVRGAGVVRITPDLICKMLHITKAVYSDCLDAIRSAALAVV